MFGGAVYKHENGEFSIQIINTSTGEMYMKKNVSVGRVFPDGNTYRVSQLTGDVKQKHNATTAHISQLKSWGNKDKIDDGEPVSDESEDYRSNGPELRTTKPDSSPVTFSDSSDGETGRDQNNPRIRPIRERRRSKYLKDFCQKMFDPQSYVAKWKEMGAMASVVLSSSDSPDVE
uniref:Uncharacterized protein n=1 Tax=Timema bartmani TaxID=61472 RepID=A0A7R9F3F5_9NEOP|nr:unnamed protein product [Timema bartmani]